MMVRTGPEREADMGRLDALLGNDVILDIGMVSRGSF